MQKAMKKQFSATIIQSVLQLQTFEMQIFLQHFKQSQQRPKTFTTNNRKHSRRTMQILVKFLCKTQRKFLSQQASTIQTFQRRKTKKTDQPLFLYSQTCTRHPISKSKQIKHSKQTKHRQPKRKERLSAFRMKLHLGRCLRTQNIR